MSEEDDETDRLGDLDNSWGERGETSHTSKVPDTATAGGLPTPPSADSLALKRLLREKEEIISNLATERDGLESRASLLEEQIVSLNDKLSRETLERAQQALTSQAHLNEIAGLKNSTACLEAERETLRVQLSDERAKALDVNSQNQDLSKQLAASREEVVVATRKVNSLTDRVYECDVFVAEARDNLSVAREDAEIRSKRIGELETSVEEMQHKLDAALRESDALKSALKEKESLNEALQQEVKRLTLVNGSVGISLSKSETRLAAVEASLLEAQNTVNAKNSEIEQMLVKLGETEEANVGLSNELDMHRMEMESLEARFNTAQEQLGTLREESKVANSRAEGYAGELADSKQQLADAEELRESTERRTVEAQQELNRKISTLEAKVCTDQAELERLGSSLRDLEIQLEQEKATLCGVRAEELRSRMELESERQRSSVLEAGHASAMEKAQVLEARVSVLSADLQERSRSIDSLKCLIDSFRTNQVASLDALSSKVCPLKVIHLLRERH